MSINTRQSLEEIERSYMERSREALETDKNKSAFYAAYAAGIRRAITEIMMREDIANDAE